MLNGWPFTVAGVLPKNFRFLFPQQFAIGDARDIDAYIPIPDALMVMPAAGVAPWEEAMKRFGPAPFWIVVVGKLRSNAAFETSHTEMQAIYGRVVAQDPGPLRQGRVPHFMALQEKVAGNARRP